MGNSGGGTQTCLMMVCDPRIAAAIDTITAEEYAGYIRQLQNFKTRYTETPGCDAARDQGASRSINQPSSPRRYRNRSWRRLGRPCQNSIRSGSNR